MLRFLFWLFLLANVIFLGMNFGFLPTQWLHSHDAERVPLQLKADQLRIIPTQKAESWIAADLQAQVPACIELASFTSDEATRVENLFKNSNVIKLGDRLQKQSSSETAVHMVYIPPLANKDAAEKKAAELKRLGIKDFFIVQDNSPLRWGISLGVFRSEESARQHLVNLTNKGVRSARIGSRPVTSNKFIFQLTNLTREEYLNFMQLEKQFPTHESRSCVGK